MQKITFNTTSIPVVLGLLALFFVVVGTGFAISMGVAKTQQGIYSQIPLVLSVAVWAAFAAKARSTVRKAMVKSC